MMKRLIQQSDFVRNAARRWSLEISFVGTVAIASPLNIRLYILEKLIKT